MVEMEKIFFWAAVFVYALSCVLYLSNLVLKQERHANWGYYALISGFAAETAAIAVRWAATGHFPTVGNYENALAGSWLIVLFTIYLISRFTLFKYASIGTIACSLLIMGIGVMSNPTLRPMNA